MEPVDPRQLAALKALRPDTPAGWLVIYVDGTAGMARDDGHATQIAQRTHGIKVRLLPDPRDLPPADG
ncbi:MAG: hypothetical protein EKK62_12840 [Acidimicrobiia bacterium]|nr:MAG: hypothetical protein EKK62_12840 [Acidimicrobiia bacterium]